MKLLNALRFEKVNFPTTLLRSVSLRKSKTTKAEMRAATAAYIHANLKPSSKPWF